MDKEIILFEHKINTYGYKKLVCTQKTSIFEPTKDKHLPTKD